MVSGEITGTSAFYEAVLFYFKQNVFLKVKNRFFGGMDLIYS
jgi:hypothetical protein